MLHAQGLFIATAISDRDSRRLRKQPPESSWVPGVSLCPKHAAYKCGSVNHFFETNSWK